MLKIRLQRIGKKGQAYFRVVLVEHTKKPKGEYLELLGTYNPHQKEMKVKKERIEYWISKGAQTSPTVNNLLVNYKIWDKAKVQSWKPKRKPESAEGSKSKDVAVSAPEPKKQQPEVIEEPVKDSPDSEVK